MTINGPDTEPGGEPCGEPGGDPRFYGRRKGKRLKLGQKDRLETLYPRLRLSLPPEGEALDPFSLFPHPVREVWLEIGFGGGEHLAAQAKANPDVGFIGAEPFINGIAKLVRSIEAEGLTNIRIYGDDVRPFLERLPTGCLSRAFLLFPDPWPKARHARRRFICPENLAALARLLKLGAQFRVASDDMSYIRWTLRHAPVHPAFSWAVQGPADWRHRWADASPSRYEEKALRQGRHPKYLTFLRKGV